MLAVRGIRKQYGANAVLDDVSFDVHRGEILGLIGPNGAGKTTLFECLAGLLPRDAGEIHAEAPLFYLPDAIRPWPEQSVNWAMGFFESMWRRPPGTARELARELKLESLSGSRVGALSKGEAKRLLLALGLLTPHALLLLDEPFDGLDFRQTREVMALLKTVPGSGRTLFVSIHQLTDAARLCDRLILLSRGRVVAIGSLDELRAQAGLPEAPLEEIFLALT